MTNDVAATISTPTRARPQRSRDRPRDASGAAPNVPPSPTVATCVGGRLEAGSYRDGIRPGVDVAAAPPPAIVNGATASSAATGCGATRTFPAAVRGGTRPFPDG